MREHGRGGGAASGKRTKVCHGHNNATAASHPSPQSSPRSRPSSPIQPVSVHDSLYCTQQCLQSLIRPSARDHRECPNYAEHVRDVSQKPSVAKQLRQQLRTQLAVKAKDMPLDYDWGYCVLTSAVGTSGHVTCPPRQGLFALWFQEIAPGSRVLYSPPRSPRQIRACLPGGGGAARRRGSEARYLGR